jgi:hypothetical protein
MVAVPRHVRLSIACLLMLAAWPAMAWPTLSLEAGPSFIGGYCSTRDSTASAFVEALFDARRIGSSDFRWTPDAMAGWVDGRNRPRTVFRRYSVHDHIWLVAAGARFSYGADDAWYRHLFFSFQPTAHTGLTPGLSSWYEFTYTSRLAGAALVAGVPAQLQWLAAHAEPGRGHAAGRHHVLRARERQERCRVCSTSPAPRRLDRGDVDLGHPHHGVEGAPGGGGIGVADRR